MIVYFGQEVEKALKNYLEVRKGITPVTGHEHALFYSTQRKRIGIPGSRKSCKKYTSEITTTKENHASQAAQHLWYRAVPGNR